MKVLSKSLSLRGPVKSEEEKRKIEEIAGAVAGADKVDQAVKDFNERIGERDENAMEAIRRSGLQPVKTSIRGGTDGSKLTFRGLPCPNIFTGGYNFHGKLEFNSRRGLEKTTETLVHLVQVFAERRS